MEQPDAKGYVNIKWPSNNVPHGGIFHTKIAETTQAQQNFLKVLLEESKLSIVQRQKDNWGLRQKESKVEREVSLPMIRPRTSRRRSLSAIRASGIYDEELYRPLKRGEDREKMKERLANFMAFGDVTEQIKAVKARTEKTAPKLPTSKEKWNEILTQIRERAEWLEEMEYLGEASPHRDIIKDQIAERMRALDALGVDSSECSSNRSTASGFSTTRSRESIKRDYNTVKKTEDNIKSKKSGKEKTMRHSTRRDCKEENVIEYCQFSPLRYSPRRRV